MSWSVLTTAMVDLEDRDIEVESIMDVGRPVSILFEQARDAELVVFGSRGRSDFASYVLGSTSLQVAMHAPCPVIVFRTAFADHQPGPSGRVVVGVDGGEISEAAIAFAFDGADRRGSELTAVHAFQWPDDAINSLEMSDWEAAAEDEERALLSERLAGWNEKYPGMDVIQRTMRVPSASAVIADSMGAALTVVGSRGAGGFSGLLLGSVSHAVLHEAGSPVAIVRTEKEM